MKTACVVLVLAILGVTKAALEDCVQECHPSDQVDMDTCPLGMECSQIGCSQKCLPILTERQIACLRPCNADMLLRQLGFGSCNPGSVCVFDGLCHTCLPVTGLLGTL
ncbi:unnamed protein product [Lymnaea stagnalis]|uniref:Uncharacterized protein n=1 Tax=Lymnaea stagnalis TaxID=6523 RepID=A0AAV2IFX0_LYMST